MGIVLRAFAYAAAVVTAPARSVLRRRAVPKGSWVRVQLRGKVVDVDGPLPPLARLAGAPPRTSLYALGRIARAIAADDRVAGLFLELRDASFSFAQAEGIRAAIATVRAAGKPVAFFAPEGLGTAAYFVASAASRVILGPVASLNLLGFAARPLYLKGLLDRLGVEADVYAKGRFKSMGELFSRESMSDAQHEQTDALLDTLYSAVVRGIAEGRSVTEEQARALIDDGPYLGARAKAAGLVDELLHEDELPAALGLRDPNATGGGAEGATATGVFVEAAVYDALTRTPLLPAVVGKKRLVVLPVRGNIVGGERAGEGFVADRPFLATVRALAKDPSVLGVILLVDSGGGSALASDRMHHGLVALAKKKPLVAYFSGVAASGGYYLGAAAAKIYARPTTITGSIGVVSIRPVVDGALGRLGVVRDGVTRGRHAGLLESGRRLDDEERAALYRDLDGFYDRFLTVVCEGRGLTREEAIAVAEGRVWSGAAARENGLVDALGGLEDAVEACRALVGPSAAAAELAVASGPRPPLGALLRSVFGAAAAPPLLEALSAFAARVGVDAAAAQLLAERGPLYLAATTVPAEEPLRASSP